ncbi:hypothetical protein [Yersinia enterocolitica]|uniref:hypothetical protein n=1 Tax=Yersinia enterocolitica TaxID=630 RepID=UPI003F41F745
MIFLTANDIAEFNAEIIPNGRPDNSKIEAIANRVLNAHHYDRVNDLRSRALYPDTRKTDSAASRSIAARRLTYAQAVLWIEPLLGLLDEANKDRRSIREIERIRATPAP